MILFAVGISVGLFAVLYGAAVAGMGATLAAAIATASLMFDFFVYQHAHDRDERNRNGDYYYNIERTHLLIALPRSSSSYA